MLPGTTAVGLMRSLGLDVDGPARWGSPPSSQAAGIFVVERADPRADAPIDPVAVRRWLDRVPDLRLDGERPTATELARRLASFWIPGQTLLYVGRTTKSLAGRVAALYATELGHRRPHPGGHWLKTLHDQPKLRLWWAATDAPEEYEDALIAAFAESVSETAQGARSGAVVLPWANLESPSGAVRDTGLTGSLLSVEASPTRASAVRRSDPSPSIRRRASSPATTTRSRRPSAAGGAPSSGSKGGPAREQPTHLTADGMAALEVELEQLRNVERPQVVERIKHARELGDLRENADYEAARNEQSFLEGRILELERQLRTAVVIRSEARSAIALGARVRYEIDGTPGELTIVGSTESDPAGGRISAASPVGRALMGRKAGETVSVTTPAAEIRYHILEVD